MTILQRLQSNNFAIYLSMIACIILCPNMIYVFYHIGDEMPIPFLREIFSVLAALLLCCFILYFIVKKDFQMSERFAYFEWFISSCYYTIRLVIIPLLEDKNINWYIVPALALAYILPWSVKQCAKTITLEDSDEVKSLKADNTLLANSLNDANILVEKTHNLLVAKINEMSSLYLTIAKYEKGINKIIRPENNSVEFNCDYNQLTKPDFIFPDPIEQVNKTEIIIENTKPISRVTEAIKEAKEILTPANPDESIWRSHPESNF